MRQNISQIFLLMGTFSFVASAGIIGLKWVTVSEPLQITAQLRENNPYLRIRTTVNSSCPGVSLGQNAALPSKEELILAENKFGQKIVAIGIFLSKKCLEQDSGKTTLVDTEYPLSEIFKQAPELNPLFLQGKLRLGVCFHEESGQPEPHFICPTFDIASLSQSETLIYQRFVRKYWPQPEKGSSEQIAGRLFWSRLGTKF